jgi:hypothetical protein
MKLFMVMLSIERIEDEDSNLSGIDDGQTNEINFIQFVCPSRTVPRRARAGVRCGAVVGMDDGQTNGKFYHILLSVYHRSWISRGISTVVSSGLEVCM